MAEAVASEGNSVDVFNTDADKVEKYVVVEAGNIVSGSVNVDVRVADNVDSVVKVKSTVEETGACVRDPVKEGIYADEVEDSVDVICESNDSIDDVGSSVLISAVGNVIPAAIAAPAPTAVVVVKSAKEEA